MFQRPRADSQVHQMQVRDIDFDFDIGGFVDIVYKNLNTHYKQQPTHDEL